MSLSSLLAQAQPRLAARFAEVTMLSPDHSACILFFSLSDGTGRAHICRGAGADFSRAWQDGIRRCQSEASRRKLAVRWLRIDRVTAIEPLTWGELTLRLSRTKRNYFRFGVSLDAELKHAFLEPELCAHAMLYPGSDTAKAGLNEKNFSLRARQRFGKKLTLDFSPDTPVWLFVHEGAFFADDPELTKLPGGNLDDPDTLWLPGPTGTKASWQAPTCLNAGRRQLASLQADEVFALVDSSANFLARQVKNSGQFIYGHFPCFGRVIPTYNALRHASSIYSMLEAWEVTRDDNLLAAIRRALDYLVDTLIRYYPQVDGRKLAFNVDINGEIKLGANAVSLLALVKYDELTGDTRHRPLMEQLALGIVHMQDAASGKFVHVLHAEDLSVKEAFRIVYYDGEAAFGLMRLYGLTKDPRWLAIVERAFDYFLQADHWQHHDHWLSYCANELTLYRPEEKYFRFGVQNIAGYLDFILQRETTYPTLLELSMAFEAMLRRIENDHPRMHHVLDGLDIEKFHRALHHRAHYLLNGFFWPELAMYFAKPQTVLGSFFIRHHSFRVRIDDIEHYLSGYVAYWKMLNRGDKGCTQPSTNAEEPAKKNSLPNAVSKGFTAVPPTRGPIVIWGGDVNLGRRQHYRTKELGVENVFRTPVLSEADLVIVNLECVVATQGEQGTKKGEDGPYYYRARPEMLRVLCTAGINLVATANNHSGDYGPQALLEQGKWLDATSIGYAGSGVHENAAFLPVFRRTGNLNVALFSIDATQPRFAATTDAPGSAYLPLDNPAIWKEKLAPRIALARTKAHVVLIAVHWGANHAVKPSAEKIAVGHAIIESGADAVLGASAHVLQGIEIYHGRPILHDAGDLLFDSVRRDLGDGGLFQLELCAAGVKRVNFVPVGIGFGFTEQRSGEDAISASQRFAAKCGDLGTSLTVTGAGGAYIQLDPPPRDSPAFKSAPQSCYILSVLDQEDLQDHSRWQVNEIPADAKIEPVRFGPITLLGIRVKPLEITRRRMLWLESFWRCDEKINEDVRIDLRGVPVKPTKMRPWGEGMDHDPCDWMVPTSRWQPGVIYRDYYGLRPPYLKDWENIDLRLTVSLIAKEFVSQPVPLPLIVNLAIPGKEQKVTSSASEQSKDTLRYAFSSSELAPLIGGYWAYPPRTEIYIDYFVTGTGLVEQPRTCMVCMYYETWLKGTGNTGHYKNIFSDSHISFVDRYKKLHLEDKVNCLIVQRPIPEVAHIPQLVVEDSYQILKILAATARKKMADNGTVFAVTGAVGKSTTCDLLTRCVRPFSNCIAMTNGHNSRTGVTIWTASLGMFDSKFNQSNGIPNTCVLEVAGSALWLKDGWVMKAVRPNIAVITHIELTQYGPTSRTIEDVAYFKSRICEAMYPGGSVVLYREMPLYEKVLEYVENYGATPYSYGESHDADTALLSYSYSLPTIDQPNPRLTMTVKANVLGEEVVYDVGAVGKSVALNSLAALTAAKLAGFDIKAAAKQLIDFKARKNTLDVSVHSNVLLIDCSHNLEIPSILAAFDVLKASNFSKSGRRVVVMSRIVNLGEIAAQFHLKLEGPFKSYGFDKVFIHNPNHEWDDLLPKLPDGLVGGVSPDAKDTVSKVMDYVQQGDSLLLLGASRGCDFGEVLPGVLKQIREKFRQGSIDR